MVEGAIWGPGRKYAAAGSRLRSGRGLGLVVGREFGWMDVVSCLDPPRPQARINNSSSGGSPVTNNIFSLDKEYRFYTVLHKKWSLTHVEWYPFVFALSTTRAVALVASHCQ